jgi:predicted cupin superfamily sugar epimerase
MSSGAAATTAPQLYSYSETNDALIKRLALQPHPEGGHYALTYVSSENVASPYASQGASRAVQTTIYYLLSMGQDAPDNNKEGIERIHDHSSSMGVMHKNKSTVSGSGGAYNVPSVSMVERREHVA